MEEEWREEREEKRKLRNGSEEKYEQRNRVRGAQRDGERQTGEKTILSYNHPSETGESQFGARGVPNYSQHRAKNELHRRK